MVYTPSVWTLSCHSQAVWFLLLEFVENYLLGTVKYDRRIFRLKDGGQIAIDWLRQTTTKVVSRDIVVLVPGIGGDQHELYSLATAKQCRTNDFDCVVVNYRGSSGVPLLVSLFLQRYRLVDSENF